MSDKSSPLVPTDRRDERSPDLVRVLLAICCALAVLLAATVVPAVSAGELGSSPAGSIVPEPFIDPFGGSGSGGGAPSGGLDGASALGALNPGERTGVGGSLASEERSSAFRSQNAETHFTVKSSTPSYWRTGAYDTYTGGGWERSGEPEPYTGAIEGDGIRGREVRYEVTLNSSATALPSVWRPSEVSGIDDLSVTDDRALVTDEVVAAGTTYTGVSYRPPRDPTVLRTAGRDYPDQLRERYSALPNGTESRVGQFTRNLTADTESPYETAVAIESWLEANKSYSLDVAQPPDSDVASQFIFEMDAGYCEYFATSMAVMLRSQGIPARYVVGYSTGQQIDSNTYDVRAMNAHAWVEVYFPEVGWVRFDPTPGDSRLQAEQQAFEQQESGTYAPTEEGSPNETFSASTPDGSTTTPATANPTATAPTTTPTTESTTQSPGSTSTPTRTPPSTPESGSGSDSPGEDETEDTPTEGMATTEITLDRTPIPGREVTVLVTRGDAPSIGRPVYFNGEPVGMTDAAGKVTAMVPYAERLTVSVGMSSSNTDARGGLPPLSVDHVASPPPSLAFGQLSSFQPSSSFLASTQSLGQTTAVNETGNETENGSRSYTLETDVTLTVSGDAVTGNVVAVTATIEEVPVPNATVQLDGWNVGRTDEHGRVRVELPAKPGNVTLTAARGSASGRTTIALPALSVAVDPALPIALPGMPVEVTTSYGNEHVGGVPVTIAGTEVGTTGVDGTLTATLPFQNSATISVARDSQSQRTTISGLLVNLTGVLVGLALLGGGLVYGSKRTGLTPRVVARWFVGVCRAFPGFAVAVLFATVDWIEDAIRRVRDGLQTLLESVIAVIRGGATVEELLSQLRTWAETRVSDLQARLAASPVFGTIGNEETRPSARPMDESYLTVREAWSRFLSATSVRDPATMTPGELAAHAVYEDGLPPKSVVAIRDVFRDVEYGARAPEDQVGFVEEALEAIEAVSADAAASAETGAETGTEAGSKMEAESETETATVHSDGGTDPDGGDE